VVYTENFENGVSDTPVLLTKYKGAAPLEETYTANKRLLENCDGYIVEFESHERKTATDCEEVAYNRVRQMAWVLGKLRGVDPVTNHAVTGYTDGGGMLPVNAVQFETVKPIPLVTSNRFITFSVDVSETNCGHAHAELKFYLLNGALEIPTFTSPIDPCTNPNAKVIEPPTLGTKPAEPFKAGSLASDSSTLFSGSALGIRMINGQRSEAGNDMAFDNVEALDVTPQLDKSFSPTTAHVGATSQLTFTITNTSELAAKNGWSFTDTLPAGLVVATPAEGSTTCLSPTVITAPAGGSSIVVSGNLAAGMNYCTVTVDVTSAKVGSYTNGPDDVTEKGVNPPGEATVTFGAEADLQIEKSAAPIPGVPDANETYTLKVTNNGPDTAENVSVSDPLPPGLSFVSASSQCKLAAPAEVTCELGSLALHDSVTLTIVGHIAATVTDGFVNTATVSSTTPDPDHSNNSASADTPIPPQADLEIQKTASLQTVTAGGQVSYTLVVNNNGPHDATGVTVTDPLPPQLSVLSAMPSQGSCSTSNGVVCALGAIAKGGSAQILVTASVAASASSALINTAHVTGDQTDPDPSNNSSSATIAVTPLTPQPLNPGPTPLSPLPAPAQPVSDLAIVKHVNRTTAFVGQKLTYTLTVTNHGLDDAPEVNVTDTASLALAILAVHATQGSCHAGRPATCMLGTLKRDASATITVVTRVKEAGQEINAAKVTSTNKDPDLSNNESSVTTNVVRRHKHPPAPRVTG
jgi:uncharacterized repeat protein (TIGR01451 family)